MLASVLTVHFAVWHIAVAGNSAENHFIFLALVWFYDFMLIHFVMYYG